MEGVGNDEDLVIYGDDGSMIMKGIEPRTSWSIVRSTKHSANLRTLHILNNLSLNNNKKNQKTDSPKSLLACKVLMECCVSSMQTQYMQRR